VEYVQLSNALLSTSLSDVPNYARCIQLVTEEHLETKLSRHWIPLDESLGAIITTLIKIRGSIGRARRRWEGNFRMVLREIRWEGVDWTHLSQDRDQWWALVNMVMNLRVP
jgi:hypothetical protein